MISISLASGGYKNNGVLLLDIENGKTVRESLDVYFLGSIQLSSDVRDLMNPEQQKRLLNRLSRAISKDPRIVRASGIVDFIHLDERVMLDNYRHEQEENSEEE